MNALWADLLANLVVTANPPTYTRLAWRHGAGQYDLVSQSDQQAVSSAAQLSFGRWIVAVGTSTGIAQGRATRSR